MNQFLGKRGTEIAVLRVIFRIIKDATALNKMTELFGPDLVNSLTQ